MNVRPGVAVAVHALAVRQAARLGVAGRRRGAGVGHGHDEVGVDRVLEGELLAHPPADLVQVAALHVRVGPGEVDELEHAQRRVRPRRSGRERGGRPGSRTTISPGLDVAHELGADDVEAGRLRREAPAAARRPASTQAAVVAGRRAVARPAGSRPRTSGRKPYGSRTPMTRCSSRMTRLNAPRTRGRTWRSASTVSAAGSSASSAVSSSVSVEAGRRARPPLQLVEQLAGVDEVAVVADGDRPARPQAVGRLGVLPDRRAGRRVAAVGDGEVAAQARQAPLVEDRADHPEVLVEHQLLAVADRDPGRLLAAVLEREQAERGDRGGLGRLGVRARPHRTRRTSGRRPPSRARAAGRGPRRAGGPRAATSSASATRLPRSSAAPGRAGAGELDDEPVAADGPSASTGRPCWRASRIERRREARPWRSTTRRDGLSPNSSTAGEIADRRARTPAPRPPHIAPSARATASPPPDTSWALATSPRAIASRMNAWSGRLAGEVERRRAVLDGDAGESGVGRPGQPGRGLADEQDVSPSAANAGPTSAATSSSSPTTPISAVGAIAPPGDSL